MVVQNHYHQLYQRQYLQSQSAAGTAVASGKPAVATAPQESVPSVSPTETEGNGSKSIPPSALGMSLAELQGRMQVNGPSEPENTSGDISKKYLKLNESVISKLDIASKAQQSSQPDMAIDTLRQAFDEIASFQEDLRDLADKNGGGLPPAIQQIEAGLTRMSDMVAGKVDGIMTSIGVPLGKESAKDLLLDGFFKKRSQATGTVFTDHSAHTRIRLQEKASVMMDRAEAALTNSGGNPAAAESTLKAVGAIFALLKNFGDTSGMERLESLKQKLKQ